MLSVWILSQLILFGFFQAGDLIHGPSASLAQLGEFPYMAKIMSLRDGKLTHCGGAIIDSTHVLTAAHCVFGFLKEEISIIAGAVDLFSICRIEHPSVGGIHIHEEYSFSKARCGITDLFQQWFSAACRCCQNKADDYFSRHDIAVLTLVEALPFGNYIKAVNLPNLHFSSQYQTCEFAGWGKTERKGPCSNHLYSTRMVILSVQECIERLTRLHSSEFCAIDPLFETCGLMGDSGSPLVLDNVVYGVYVRGFDNPLRTSVFTKVSGHLEFIREALRK